MNLSQLSSDVGSSGAGQSALKLSKTAADWLSKNIEQYKTIGVAWGASLGETISKIKKKNTCKKVFIPIVGGPSHVNSEYHVNTLVYNLAKKFNGESIFINASVIQETKEVAKGILNSNYFNDLKKKLAKFRHSTCWNRWPFKL